MTEYEVCAPRVPIFVTLIPSQFVGLVLFLAHHEIMDVSMKSFRYPVDLLDTSELFVDAAGNVEQPLMPSVSQQQTEIEGKVKIMFQGIHITLLNTQLLAEP